MSDASERLSAIQNTYEDALDNEPHDLAGAKTAADVTAIQANLAVARNTYYAALAAALTNNGPEIEAGLAAATKTLAAVKAARTAAADIPTLLGKLTSATGAATNLLNIAKAAAG